MTATAAGIAAALARLETGEAAAGAACIVQYRTTDTPEEIQRRIPAGAALAVLLPWNGRDAICDPGPPPEQ